MIELKFTVAKLTIGDHKEIEYCIFNKESRTHKDNLVAARSGRDCPFVLTIAQTKLNIPILYVPMEYINNWCLGDDEVFHFLNSIKMNPLNSKSFQKDHRKFILGGFAMIAPLCIFTEVVFEKDSLEPVTERDFKRDSQEPVYTITTNKPLY